MGGCVDGTGAGRDGTRCRERNAGAIPGGCCLLAKIAIALSLGSNVC
jgi:hypothetical protein